jgi:hypothetical protein
LVKKYYGGGVFLTPEKRIAWRYAEANRNIGFDQSIIDDLKSVNPNAGTFLESLYKKGFEGGWDELLEITLGGLTGDKLHAAIERHFKGVDPNDISDVAAYVVGSKAIGETRDGTLEELMGVMTGRQTTGAPDYIYDSLDRIGLDSTKYRPKVYTVTVRGIHNPLVTKNLGQARRARSKGFDAVVYYGSEAVGGVPEVAIFDPRKVKIVKVET